MSSKLAIIYYSATGTVDAMARRAAQTAEKAGAEVRLRHVAETAPDEAVESQDEWAEHRSDVEGEPVAAPEDLEWADVVSARHPDPLRKRDQPAAGVHRHPGPALGGGRAGRQGLRGLHGFADPARGPGDNAAQSLHELHRTGAASSSRRATPTRSSSSDGNPYGASKVTGDTTELEDTDLDAIDHLVARALHVSDCLTLDRIA